MSKVFETAFKLAGSVSSSFINSFAQAQKQFSNLEQANSKLDRSLADVDGVLRARKQLDALRDNSSAATRAMLELHQKMNSAPGDKLAQSYEKARVAAWKARQELENQKRALQDLERIHSTAGQSTAALLARQRSLTQELGRQVQAQNKLSEVIQKQQALANAGQNSKGMIASGAGNIAAAGASMAGLFAMPVKAAIAAEEDMAELRKFSDSYQQIADLNNQMSKSIAISTRDMVALQTAAMQASILDPNDVAAIKLYTETAAKAMIALDMTGEEVGASFSEIKNKISGDMAKTVEAFDVVNAISNQTSASGKDVLEVLSRTGGAVSALTKLETNQVVALAGAFRSASNSAEVAATSQASFINALMAGAGATKNQKEGYKKLGIDAVKLARAMVASGESAEAAIFDVFARLGKLKDDERSNIIGQIFGNDAGIKSAVATLSKQADLLRKPFDIAGNKDSFAGSMQKEYESRASTTANQLVLLKNNANALASVFGSVFLPAVNSVATSIISILEPVSSWIEGTTAGFQEQAKAVLGVDKSLSQLSAEGAYEQIDRVTGGHRDLVVTAGKAIGALIALKAGLGLAKIAAGAILGPVTLLGRAFLVSRQVIIGATMALKGYQLATNASRAAVIAHAVAQKSAAAAMLVGTTAVKAARGAMLAFNLVMVANPIGLVVTAIGALAAGCIWLYRNFDTVRAKAAELWQSFQTNWPKTAAVISAVADGAGVAFGYIGQGFSALMAVWDSVSSALGTAFEKFSAFIEPVRAELSFFVSFCSGVGSAILSSFSSAFGGLASIAMAPINAVKDALASLGSGFSSVVSSISNSTVGRWIGKLWGGDEDKPAVSAMANTSASVAALSAQAVQPPPAAIGAASALSGAPVMPGMPLFPGAVGPAMTALPPAGVQTSAVTSIPALAEGGLVSKPTLALIGEGPEQEAVIPLSKLYEMLPSAPAPGRPAAFNPVSGGGHAAGSVTVEFKPVINISGGSGDGNTVRQIEQALSSIKNDMRQLIEKALRESERMSYV